MLVTYRNGDRTRAFLVQGWHDIDVYKPIQLEQKSQCNLFGSPCRSRVWLRLIDIHPDERQSDSKGQHGRLKDVLREVPGL